MMYQNRTCYPSQCDNTVNYVYSSVCGGIFNESLGIYTQRYKSYSNTTECLSDFVNVGTNTECYMSSGTIPIGCININVSIYPTLELNLYTSGICRNQIGDVQISSCSPSYDCSIINLTCGDIISGNTSLANTKIINALAGQSLVSKVAGFVSPTCTCPRFCLPIIDVCSSLLKGVKDYRIRGHQVVTCDLPCKEESVCLDIFNQGLGHIDCSITNATLCEYGCLNGNCLTGVTSKTPDSIFDDPIKKFFINIETLFNLSTASKFILWSITTLSICMVVLIGTKEYKNSNLISSITLTTMILIGLWSGWLPILIIAIPLILGLIIVAMKHGG